MTKELPQIGDKFKETVQKTNQEQRITDLQAEVERLRTLQSPELETEIPKLHEQLQTQLIYPWLGIFPNSHLLLGFNHLIAAMNQFKPGYASG